MTGEFCGASLFRGFPAFQRPTEAREKERHLRNFEIPGYRRGHNIPEASLEPPYPIAKTTLWLGKSHENIGPTKKWSEGKLFVSARLIEEYCSEPSFDLKSVASCSSSRFSLLLLVRIFIF